MQFLKLFTYLGNALFVNCNVLSDFVFTVILGFYNNIVILLSDHAHSYHKKISKPVNPCIPGL